MKVMQDIGNECIEYSMDVDGPIRREMRCEAVVSKGMVRTVRYGTNTDRLCGLGLCILFVFLSFWGVIRFYYFLAFTCVFKHVFCSSIEAYIVM
jgi:hypothetical protein